MVVLRRGARFLDFVHYKGHRMDDSHLASLAVSVAEFRLLSKWWPVERVSSMLAPEPNGQEIRRACRDKWTNSFVESWSHCKHVTGSRVSFHGVRSRSKITGLRLQQLVAFHQVERSSRVGKNRIFCCPDRLKVSWNSVSMNDIPSCNTTSEGSAGS